MRKKDYCEARRGIEEEGINYAFMNLTDFPDVKDKEFHVLREKYIAVVKEIETYLDLLTVDEMDLPESWFEDESEVTAEDIKSLSGQNE